MKPNKLFDAIRNMASDVAFTVTDAASTVNLKRQDVCYIADQKIRDAKFKVETNKHVDHAHQIGSNLNPFH